MVLEYSWERERTGDSKLLNHMSDFRRNNTIMLRCFNGNSVIDGNLKWAWTVCSNMPITLTLITPSRCTKFRSFLEGVAKIIISFFFEVVLSGGGLGARLIELGIGGSPSHTRF